jgi:hypothetical protein
MVGRDDSIVLDCYRLARIYHQHPNVFLEMTLAEVQLHLHRTIELANTMQESSSGDE